MSELNYDLANNKNLDGIPEPFLKYCRFEERLQEEPKVSSPIKTNANYQDMLFMMLVFSYFFKE